MNRNAHVPFLGEERAATLLSLPDPRTKAKKRSTKHAFRTGDIVRATVPAHLKNAGTHAGRMAARARGSFTITTAAGTVTDIGHRYCTVLQRADGYAYVHKKGARGSLPTPQGD